MADPVPTTRLEAVNRMISTIGVTRVSSIPLPDREDVNEAEAVLAEALRAVQIQGWEFNTDDEYELALVAGKIAVPTNAAQVAVPFYRHQKHITQRSDSGTMRLYDKTNKTFTFTHAVKADIVWMFEFEDLPQVARWYITIRATREYVDRMLAGGEGAIGNFTEQDERLAYADLLDAETDAGDYSIFDNYNAFFTLNRGVPF